MNTDIFHYAVDADGIATLAFDYPGRSMNVLNRDSLRAFYAEQIEAAKAICRLCEVRGECLDYALTTNQESGVWGGTSEEERRKLRKSWLARQRRSA